MRSRLLCPPKTSNIFPRRCNRRRVAGRHQQTKAPVKLGRQIDWKTIQCNTHAGVQEQRPKVKLDTRSSWRSLSTPLNPASTSKGLIEIEGSVRIHKKTLAKTHLKFEIQHFFANAFQTTLPPKKRAISFQGRSLASLVAHRCATQSKSIA